MNLEERGAEIAADIERVEAELAGEEAEAAVSLQIERAAVAEAREQGATWSQVAQALNRSRQAVEQRFG